MIGAGPRMEPTLLPSMLGPAMLPTLAPPHEEVSYADLPGNRKIGVAPVHGGRRGPPVRPPQRSRRDAIPQRWQADAARGDRARVPREFRGGRLLGGRREGHRGVPGWFAFKIGRASCRERV